MDITDGQYPDQINYTLCSQRWRSSIRGQQEQDLQFTVVGTMRPLMQNSGEGNSSPLQCSCLENPMDRGAWWATVHGVAKCQTRLTD